MRLCDKIMNQVYIIDGIRTPIGKLKGSLSSVRPDDMAAFVIKKDGHGRGGAGFNRQRQRCAHRVRQRLF